MAEYVGQAQPIYVLGDSHVLAFRDLVTEHSNGQIWATRVGYCHGVVSHNFTTTQGELHPLLLQMLKQEGLLLQEQAQLQPFHYAVSAEAERRVQLTARSRQVPLLIWSQGEVDVRAIFLKKLGSQADFRLPPALAEFNESMAQLPSPSQPQRLATDMVISFAKELLTPYFKGLLRLRQQGFTQLMVLGLPPPDPDDQAFAADNHYESPASTRYKAVRIFNALLHEFCQPQHIPFLDIWSMVTRNGLRDPAYHLDSRHLNRQAARLVLQQAMGYLTPPQPLEPVYTHEYQQYRTAALAQAFDYNIYHRFSQQGTVTVQLAADWVETLLENLDFSGIPAPLPPHWSPCSDLPWDTTTLSPEQLSLLKQALLPWQSLIQSCLLTALTLVNARPLCLLQSHAWCEVCPAADPAGVLRGWLWLTPSEGMDVGSLMLFAPDRVAKMAGGLPVGTHILELIFMASAQPNQGQTYSVPLGNYPVDPVYWRLCEYVS